MSDTQPAGETLNLRQTLGRAVRSAINLRVITVVGDVTLTGTIESPTVTAPTSGPAVVTNINLLGGDIITAISPQIANGDLAELKAFHDGVVAKAEEMVERNVRLLKDLISAGFETIGGAGERR
jgi:hypothetical protein